MDVSVFGLGSHHKLVERNRCVVAPAFPSGALTRLGSPWTFGPFPMAVFAHFNLLAPKCQVELVLEVCRIWIRRCNGVQRPQRVACIMESMPTVHPCAPYQPASTCNPPKRNIGNMWFLSFAQSCLLKPPVAEPNMRS